MKAHERSILDYLNDIHDASEKAATFVNGLTFEQFQANDEKVYAVILEGMKGKAADKGGKITINSLATVIEEELPKLTFKKWGYEQIPQKTLQGMDFQIGIR